MENSAIAVRYAKAFLELAKEKNLIQELKEDMQTMYSICQESKDFVLLLESPIINTSKKKEVIAAIFQGKIHNYTLKFLNLILENNRETQIPDISRNFLTMVRENQKIKSAVFTTATQMSDELISKLKSMLEQKYQTTIELTDKVNPDILGGFVLRLEDQQYDASIATRLKRVKEELLETELKN
ncbi:MAG: ATP synthase F1 subunit delta [Draconibacterium sp.]|nr:MAG: ATP synthase F1 subunit delta [Draconibacterium sp.]